MNKYTEAKDAVANAVANLMFIAFEEGKADFSENQVGFNDLQKAMAEGIGIAVEYYDQLLFATRPACLTPIKTADRTLLSLKGDISYKRRIYTNEAGETIALVDEALAIQKSQKMVPSFQAVLSELSLEQSFEKTARTLEACGASYVSKETVKHSLEQTEHLLSEHDDEAMHSLFDLGEVPEGKHEAEDVYVEIDSTFVPSQEEDKKKICIKGASLYAGKERQHNKTVRIEPAFVYTQEDTQTFKKRVVTEVFQQFQREKIKRIHIGFDGEAQYKTGWQSLFGQNIDVKGYIDPYHLNKYIEKTFSKHTKATKDLKNQMFHLLNGGFTNQALSLLENLSSLDAPVLSRLVNTDALEDLKKYLANNFDYIKALPKRASLGTIESDHMRVAKARMCARPCGWSQKGAHALVRANASRLSNKPIPICKKDPAHIEIKRTEAKGDNKTIIKIELKENKLQSKNKTEYIYAYQGSIVGAPAGVRYVAKQYGNHIKGTY